MQRINRNWIPKKIQSTQNIEISNVKYYQRFQYFIN